MIGVDGTVLKLTGPVTIETHTVLRDKAASHIAQSGWSIDWSGVTELDSSALSLIFAWQRMSLAEGTSIHNINLPNNLKALAELYGVSEFISAA